MFVRSKFLSYATASCQLILPGGKTTRGWGASAIPEGRTLKGDRERERVARDAVVCGEYRGTAREGERAGAAGVDPTVGEPLLESELAP